MLYYVIQGYKRFRGSQKKKFYTTGYRILNYMDAFKITLLLGYSAICAYYLYRFLNFEYSKQKTNTDETPKTRKTPQNDVPNQPSNSTKQSESDDFVTCPECGTQNKSTYNFCENCVTSL